MTVHSRKGIQTTPMTKAYGTGRTQGSGKMSMEKNEGKCYPRTLLHCIHSDKSRKGQETCSRAAFPLVFLKINLTRR